MPSKIENSNVKVKKNPSLGGLEPPTFRLTAERANRLRHRDRCASVI